MNTWLKFEIITHPSLVDAITDFLVGVMSAGVEQSAEERSALITLSVFLKQKNPSAAEIARSVSMIENHLEQLSQIFHVEIPRLSWEELEEQDWGVNWKKHFSPFHLSPKIVIAPSWQIYSPRNEEIVIIMDPGMAFGTGHHATTALAAGLIEEQVDRAASGITILDVGTGTGVLAMVAAILGAERVYAVDNDPVAVETARSNIELNNLSHCIQVGDESVDEIQDQFSLVVANIVHDVLFGMKDELLRLTKKNGHVILSGILTGEQEKTLSEVYEKAGFVYLRSETREEWVALLFRRK